MKLILENWRNYREDALLVEEIGNLFNQLEQQLLNEDLMDSLSDTWESIKTSTGKAKDKAIEIYNKIMEKINDWILKVSVKVHDMAKSTAKGALSLLINVLNKIAAFCGKHKTLCKVITVVIVTLAVYTVMSYMFTGEAEASVYVDMRKLTQEELDAFEAAMKLSGDTLKEEYGFDGIKAAAKLRELHLSDNIDIIKADAGELSGQVESLIRAIRAKKETDPEQYNQMVEFGSKIHAEIEEIVQTFKQRVEYPTGGGISRTTTKTLQSPVWVKGQ